MMESMEFRVFLDLLMCSDPWLLENDSGKDIIIGLADRVAHDYGFTDWMDAYHKHAA